MPGKQQGADSDLLTDGKIIADDVIVYQLELFPPLLLFG
jgi:hypothetical protein